MEVNRRDSAIVYYFGGLLLSLGIVVAILPIVVAYFTGNWLWTLATPFTAAVFIAEILWISD